VIKRMIENRVVKYSKCGWDGVSCTDAGCLTISKFNSTSLACNKEIKNCVSANPVGGEVRGCMDLPKSCSDR
jgi:hypothetical protein